MEKSHKPDSQIPDPGGWCGAGARLEKTGCKIQVCTAVPHR
jgi:hypothetical protein